MRNNCGTLNIDIPIEETIIDIEIEKLGTIGIKDVTINGQSVVNNDVAEIVLGGGLAMIQGEITLSIGDAPRVIPKEMTIGEQEETKIIIIENGVVKQTNLNDLDYSKIAVTNDLNKVRNGDYLFKIN